ncbi:MAG: type IX secretion system membrane protein PorP/SprF [Ferruginibacter sp.]
MKHTPTLLPALLCVLLSCFFSNAASAQAKPAYNQYILNNYILNPAISGIENYTDIKFSYRNQWQQIQGAPTTLYFSGHGSLGKKDYNTTATSFEPQGYNPRGSAYWNDYTTPAAHHGIGLTAVNDRAGYINRWSVAASYAYHQPLGAKTSLAGGFSAGFSSVNIATSKINWGSLDPNDPAVGYSNGALKKMVPELGAGLFLYSDRYFAGISVLNIVPNKVKLSDQDNYGTWYSPNYFFTAGYRMQLSEDVSLLPSIMLQYWKPQLLGAHFNAKAQYRDLFWIGGSYRYADVLGGYSAMAGMYIGNAFNISYAYEVANTSRMRTYAGNTHELLVGFTLGNSYNEGCPRNIW